MLEYYESRLLCEGFDIFMQRWGLVFLSGIMPILVGFCYYLEIKTQCLSQLPRKIALYLLKRINLICYLIGFCISIWYIIFFNQKEYFGEEISNNKIIEGSREEILNNEIIENLIEYLIEVDENEEEIDELEEHLREIDENVNEIYDKVDRTHERIDELEEEIKEAKRNSNINTIFSMTATIVGGISTTFISLFGKGLTRYFARWAHKKKKERNRKKKKI